MTREEVDVLLPVFNGALTITEAVESIRRQTMANLRIFIIDDGSTDETPEILATLARKDNRITVITKSNAGIVDALNVGLRLCEAEFVARQDADDISNPSRLAAQLTYLIGHPECLAVSGSVRHIDDSGRFLGTVQEFPPADRADPKWAPSREPYLAHPFLMVRRADVQAVGGYRWVYNAEDVDLYWRLLERGKLHNLDCLLGDYRVHSGSISGRSIVDGRIQALNSQLAGLSMLRRHQGRPDISFPKEAINAYREARTLSAIYELGRKPLDKKESRFLRIAIAAKLLELSAYRPIELELDDCRFIRDAYRDVSQLSPDNRGELRRIYAATAARLLGKGLFREAVALTPPMLYPSAAARLAAKTFLPGALRRLVTRLRNVARH